MTSDETKTRRAAAAEDRDSVDESLPLWPTLEQGAREEHGIYALREVKRRSPRTGRASWYKVLEVPVWVNVVALTPEREVVLIEQYRHGIDELTLEIPGGMVDAGEDPAAAATRELREETGFTGAEPELLGSVHPNPAIQDNCCHTYLIRDARRTASMELDDGEHIRVVTHRLDDVPALIRDGVITHSLVVCGFTWLWLRDAASGSSAARSPGGAGDEAPWLL
ncbi:MAG: NUDIX hydrolase [Acidobacteriota bacterium]